MRESEPQSGYEFVTDVGVRYVDIDTQHVVNNGVYSQYLTEARAGFLEEVTDRRVEEIEDIVVGRLEIDFVRSLTRGNEVTVTARCTDVSGSSFTLDHEIFGDGDLAARAKLVLVTIDTQESGSRPVPDALRDALQR